MTITAWALVARACVALRLVSGTGPLMLGSLSIITFLILCALNATSFLRAAHNPRGMRKFFTVFAKLDKFGGAFINCQQVQKNILIGTVITWLLIALNDVIVGYLIFASSYFELIVNDPDLQPSDTKAAFSLKIIYYVLFFYLTALWMFPLPLQLSTALVVYKEYTLFSTYLRSKLTKDKRFTGCLEQERRRFQMMVKIVEAVDSGLSIHQAASFACNLANICLMLYIYIYYPSFVSTPVAIGGFTYWFTNSLADMVIVIVSGLLINSAVS